MTDKRQKATKVNCKRDESLYNTLPKSTRRNVKLNKFAFGTPWLPDLFFKHWFTSSVWNFCRRVADVPPRETSPKAKSEEKRMFSQATYVCSQSSCCKEFGLLFNIQQNQGFWYLWWRKFSYLISNRMWSHTEFEFDLKSQVRVWFQTQIARHEIQFLFYYSYI